MDIDPIFLSQLIGIITVGMFFLAAWLDNKCAVGFAFLGMAYLWLIFTQATVTDEPTQRVLVLTRGMYFRVTSFIGISIIVGIHGLDHWRQRKEKE